MNVAMKWVNIAVAVLVSYRDGPVTVVLLYISQLAGKYLIWLMYFGVACIRVGT